MTTPPRFTSHFAVGPAGELLSAQESAERNRSTPSQHSAAQHNPTSFQQQPSGGGGPQLSGGFVDPLASSLGSFRSPSSFAQSPSDQFFDSNNALNSGAGAGLGLQQRSVLPAPHFRRPLSADWSGPLASHRVPQHHPQQQQQQQQQHQLPQHQHLHQTTSLQPNQPSSHIQGRSASEGVSYSFCELENLPQVPFSPLTSHQTQSHSISSAEEVFSGQYSRTRRSSYSAPSRPMHTLVPSSETSTTQVRRMSFSGAPISPMMGLSDVGSSVQRSLLSDLYSGAGASGSGSGSGSDSTYFQQPQVAQRSSTSSVFMPQSHSHSHSHSQSLSHSATTLKRPCADTMSTTTTTSSASAASTIGNVTKPKDTTKRQKLVIAMLCAVCGDTASCQHYGVLTCEGCKGFFKRTVQKGAKYACPGSRNCIIDKRRRNACQYCRYQKCVAVGMSKDIVRGDKMRGRRGRLPSLSASSAQNLPGPSRDFRGLQVYRLEALVRAHLETIPNYCDLDYSKYSAVAAGQPCSSSNDVMMQNWSYLGASLSGSYDQIAAWANRLPEFNSLLHADQQMLINTAFLEVLILRLAQRFLIVQPTPRTVPGSCCTEFIIFCNGTVLHYSQVAPFLEDWLLLIADFALSLRRLDLADSSAITAIGGLALITERYGILDNGRVAELQMQVVEGLRLHYAEIGGSARSLQFSRALAKLPDLRSLGDRGLKTLFALRQNGYNLPHVLDNVLFGNNNGAS